MDGVFFPYVPVHAMWAAQFTDSSKNHIFNLLTGQFAADFEDGHPILKVKNISNETVTVRFGDWLIKEDKLGFYNVLPNDEFVKKYRMTQQIFSSSDFSKSPTLPPIHRF